jgi:DNA-binding response OmpR family regulator
MSEPAPPHVLIVEDDRTIVGNLVEYLEARGFAVDSAHDGAAAMARLASDTYDVIVLDLGLPRAEGLHVLQHLRRRLAVATPVLVLTARDALASKTEAFSLGADDYVVKPFALAEIELRIRALHRRARGAAVEDVRRAGPLALDRRTREVRVGGALLKLAPRITLFVAAQGVLAYLSLLEQEDELVDELVLAQARQLAARAERGELSGPHAAALLQPGPNLAAWFVDAGGAASPAPLPAHLSALADGAHRLGRPHEKLHVVVLPAAGGRLYVQYDAEQNEAKVREFGAYLIGLGAICLAFGAALSWQVAEWVVAPIERLAARLANWAPDDGRAAAPTTTRIASAATSPCCICSRRRGCASSGSTTRAAARVCATGWRCTT